MTPRESQPEHIGAILRREFKDLFQANGLPRVAPQAVDLEELFFSEIAAGREASVNALRARYRLPASKTIAGRIAALSRKRGLSPAGVLNAVVPESKARLCRKWRGAGA